MAEFIVHHYDWVKAFHVIFVISWMAGMLYLPRLYVYHATADKDSELSETLKIMERRLLRIIINPAMILALILGSAMMYANPSMLTGGGKWLHVKLGAVFLLFGFHGLLSRWRKAFLKDENKHSAAFYRKINEIPTILMVIIVIMVVVKPF